MSFPTHHPLPASKSYISRTLIFSIPNARLQHHAEFLFADRHYACDIIPVTIMA